MPGKKRKKRIHSLQFVVSFDIVKELGLEDKQQEVWRRQDEVCPGRQGS